MEKENSLIVSRHLDEVDDLKKFGRDAPLERSQLNLEKLNKIADTVYQKIEETEKEAVLFITSPRLRARETAEWIAKDLKYRGLDLKVRFSPNEDLSSTEQGGFVVPDDYNPGDFFEGLSLATAIFTKESHMSDNPGMEDNIHYEFGDPVLLPDGSYKYPELVKFFTENGESYAETLTRIYKSVLEMSSHYQKLFSKTEVVVVSHGQIYHVLRGLSEIGKMVKNRSIEFSTGDSVKLLWKIYNDCDSDQKVTGICMPLDFEALNDPELMELLKKEIAYLEKGKAEIRESELKLESLENLKKDLEALRIETGLECFLIYGSLLKGIENANDLDVIVVVDTFKKTQSIFDALKKHFPDSKLDFHVYTKDEIEGDVSFFTREYVLEYLAKGLCLCGENVFEKKFKDINPEQYKESIFIRSVEHVQMVRKTVFSASFNEEQKLRFVRKYLLRLSINILLFNGISSHENLNSMSLVEVLETLRKNNLLEGGDMENTEESTLEETFALFCKISQNLLLSRKQVR